MAYNWDNSRVNEAAEVLCVINPQGNDATSLASHIRWLAEKELTKPGYMGTGGWYVTAYNVDWDDDLHMLVTIMPYSVAAYLKGI